MTKEREIMKDKIKKSITYAFIDATNIIYGASNHGWRMDFAKLSQYLKTRFEVSRIFYYAGADNENLKQLKFYEKLQQFGYQLRLVPVKTFKDGKKKADVDSRMTFEMMRYFPEYDRVITMTGDGDFYWVLEYLIGTKDKTFLVSHRQNTAAELKKLFGHTYICLDDIKHRLSFRKTKARLVPGNVEVNPTNVFTSRDYEKIIAKNKKFVKGFIPQTPKIRSSGMPRQQLRSCGRADRGKSSSGVK